MIAWVVSCAMMSCESLTREIASLIGAVRPEVSEQDPVCVRTVVGVRLAQGVREQIKTARSSPRHRRRAFAPFQAPPMYPASERVFESLQGIARDRIDHLLVKARIAFGRRQAASDQQPMIVQIDRLIERLVRTVVIDHGETIAYRTWLDVFVPDRCRHVVADQPTGAWIKCVDAQRPLARRRDFCRREDVRRRDGDFRNGRVLLDLFALEAITSHDVPLACGAGPISIRRETEILSAALLRFRAAVAVRR